MSRRNSPPYAKWYKDIRFLVTVLSPFPGIGCIPPDSNSLCPLGVQGVFFDRALGGPLAGAEITGVGTLTGGSQTGGLRLTADSNGNRSILTDDAGGFELQVIEEAFKACPPWKYTPPDEIEFTVVRASCEVVFRVPVNAETVVNPDTSDGVLEFREPISVPPCGE